jgi:hypothetical protein
MTLLPLHIRLVRSRATEAWTEHGPLPHQPENRSRIWDTVIVDHNNLESPRIEVAKFVGETLRDHARQIWVDQDWRVDLSDDTGLILFVLHLSPYNSAAVAPAKA